MQAAKHLIERYLLLWLVLLSCLAFFWHRLAAVDIFVALKPGLPLLIVITMFAIGWMLPPDEIRQVVERWPTVLGGTAVQYLSMPTLAFLLSRQLGLSQPMMIGMVMVGCVPGAMASNVLTLVARGNVSYSVSLTTSATLLSPVFVPLALQLTLGEAVPRQVILASAVQLLWMVVFPVVVGHTMSRRFPKYQQDARTIGSIIANLAILLIIAIVVALNRDRLFQLTWPVLTALAMLNLLGYMAGYLGGLSMKLPISMRRALTLEVGMQNAGLGTTLATTLFTDSAVALPPALYTFGCMLTGTILARAWALGELRSAESACRRQGRADSNDRRSDG